MSENSSHAGTAKWISIVIMVIGAIMVLAGAMTYGTVSSTLANERITVADDANCLGGQPVAGPFAAFCQADIIAKHSLDATGGKTYAELDREDPLRTVAMNGSFLRASLFTSVVAFGVAAMAIGVGIVFILIGVALLNLAGRVGGAKAA
jgi:hypothetical protein